MGVRGVFLGVSTSLQPGALETLRSPVTMMFVISVYIFDALFYPCLYLSEFRKVVEEYSADEDLFFKDFASAFAKLISLGTPTATAAGGGGLAGMLNSLLSMLGLGKK